MSSAFLNRTSQAAKRVRYLGLVGVVVIAVFARLKHAKTELRPLILRGVERGIGVGHRFGNKETALRRRIELEETRIG